MSRQVTTDQVLRVTAGLFLGLLCWQGNRICGKVDTLDARMDALERSQTQILTTLRIPPIGGNTPENVVKSGLCAAAERINEIKPPEDTLKNSEFYP